MRKFAMMAILATSALASPAMAKDRAWYVGIDDGTVIVDKTEAVIRSVGAIDNITTRFSVAASVRYAASPVIKLTLRRSGFSQLVDTTATVYRISNDTA